MQFAAYTDINIREVYKQKRETQNMYISTILRKDCCLQALLFYFD